MVIHIFKFVMYLFIIHFRKLTIEIMLIFFNFIFLNITINSIKTEVSVKTTQHISYYISLFRIVITSNQSIYMNSNIIL